MPRWKRRLAEEAHGERLRVLRARLDLCYCRTSDRARPPGDWVCQGRALLGHPELCPRDHGARFVAWLHDSLPCADGLRVAWVGPVAYAWSPAAAPTGGGPAPAPGRSRERSRPAEASHLVPLTDVLAAAPIGLPDAVVADTGALGALRACVRAADQAGRAGLVGGAHPPVVLDPAVGLSADLPRWPLSALVRNRPAWPRTELAPDGVVVGLLRELCHLHPRVDHAVPEWDAFGAPAELRVLPPHPLFADLAVAPHPGVQAVDLLEWLGAPEAWRAGARRLAQRLLHPERALALSVPGAVAAVPVERAGWVPLFTLGAGPDDRVDTAAVRHILGLAAPPGPTEAAAFARRLAAEGDWLPASAVAGCAPGLRDRLAGLGPVLCRALRDAGATCWGAGPHLARPPPAPEPRQAARDRARDHFEHLARMALADELGWEGAAALAGRGFGGDPPSLRALFRV